MELGLGKVYTISEDEPLIIIEDSQEKPFFYAIALKEGTRRDLPSGGVGVPEEIQYMPPVIQRLWRKNKGETWFSSQEDREERIKAVTAIAKEEEYARIILRLENAFTRSKDIMKTLLRMCESGMPLENKGVEALEDRGIEIISECRADEKILIGTEEGSSYLAKYIFSVVEDGEKYTLVASEFIQNPSVWKGLFLVKENGFNLDFNKIEEIYHFRCEDKIYNIQDEKGNSIYGGEALFVDFMS